MFLIDDLLHIYQGDYYDSKRFLRFAYQHVGQWPHLQDRGVLTWSLRARLVMTCSIVLLLAVVFTLNALWPIIGALVGLLLSVILLPLYLVIASIVTLPVVMLAKHYYKKEAQHVLKKLDSLVVIGITGSYGKTTTKHILSGMLSSSLRVHTIPGNINTDIGIAKYLIANKEVLTSSDVLIVEMGAHRPGDIKSLCDVVQPQYGIITAVQGVHLERFGSIEAIARTKFELATHASIKTLVNMNDSGVRNYLTERKIDTVECIEPHAKATYEKDFAGMSLFYKDVTFKTRLLGSHIGDLVALCYELALLLQVEPEKAKRGLLEVETPKHRLEVTHNPHTEITVIDDSYNGSLNGFKAGIEVLKNADGRKVVLTPGIVELGTKNQEVHEELALLYMESGIYTLLVKTSATIYIEALFKKKGYTNFKLYENALAAHADLPNVLQSGDTIIFQNDWSDSYR